MDIEFLGGAREIGRSAILVNDSLLLDYGMRTGTPPGFPVGDVEPEAVVVSHGHLDHAGTVPSLCAGDRRPPIHWTPPTRDLALVLARDTLKLRGGHYDCPFTETEVQRVTQVSETHGYREPFEAAGHEVTFFDAGHVPGSAHVLVDDGETRLLYTGDFYVPSDGYGGDRPTDGRSSGDRSGGERSGGDSPSSERSGGDRSGSNSSSGERSGSDRSSDKGSRDGNPDTPNTPGTSREPTTRTDSRGDRIEGQRLVRSSRARPDADVVICESTYAHVEHDPRAAIEERFVERVEQTLWEGGTVVVPAFAIGRTQELLSICEAHDVPCYVDGMGKRVTRQLLQYPEFLRDGDALQRAASHARFVTGRAGQRERIAEQSAAIVTTSGMLSGGPVMTYVPAVGSDPTNAVTLTGYQVEGTPGRELLDTGRAEFDGRVRPISARVEQYDFSAHADRGGLLAFLDAYRDATVLLGHGDRCVDFAAELRAAGFDATAPAVGDAISVS